MNVSVNIYIYTGFRRGIFIWPQRIPQPHRSSDAPRGRNWRDRILLRQDGRGDEDTPNPHRSESGNRDLCHPVDL